MQYVSTYAATNNETLSETKNEIANYNSFETA